MSISFNSSSNIMNNAWNKFEEKVLNTDEATKLKLIDDLVKANPNVKKDELIKNLKEGNVSITEIKQLYEAALISEGKTGTDKTVELNDFDIALRLEAKKLDSNFKVDEMAFHIRTEKTGSASATFLLDTDNDSSNGVITSKSAQLKIIGDNFKSAKANDWASVNVNDVSRVENEPVKQKTLSNIQDLGVSRINELLSSSPKSSDTRTDFINESKPLLSVLKEVNASKNDATLTDLIGKLEDKVKQVEKTQNVHAINTLMSDSLGSFLNLEDPKLTSSILQAKHSSGSSINDLITSLNTDQLQKIISHLNQDNNIVNNKIIAQILFTEKGQALFDDLKKEQMEGLLKSLMINSGDSNNTDAKKLLGMLQNSTDPEVSKRYASVKLETLLSPKDKTDLIVNKRNFEARLTEAKKTSPDMTMDKLKQNMEKEIVKTTFVAGLKDALEGWPNTNEDAAVVLGQSVINGEVPASVLAQLDTDETLRLFSIMQSKAKGNVDDLANKFVEAKPADFADKFKKIFDDNKANGIEVLKALLSNESTVPSKTVALNQFKADELLGMLDGIKNNPKLLGEFFDTLKSIPNSKFVDVINEAIKSPVDEKIQKNIIGALNTDNKFKDHLKGIKDVPKLFDMADKCEVAEKENFYLNAVKAGIDVSKLNPTQQNTVVDIILKNDDLKNNKDLLVKTFNDIPKENTSALAKLREKLLDPNDNIDLDVSKVNDLNKLFNGIRQTPVYTIMDKTKTPVEALKKENGEDVTSTQFEELMKKFVSANVDISKLSNDSMKVLGEKLLEQPKGETKVDEKTASLIRRFAEANKDNISVIGHIVKTEGILNPRVSILATGLDGKVISEKNKDVARILMSAMLQNSSNPDIQVKAEDVVKFAQEIAQDKSKGDITMPGGVKAKVDGKVLLEKSLENMRSFEIEASKDKTDFVSKFKDGKMQVETANYPRMSSMFDGLITSVYAEKQVSVTLPKPADFIKEIEVPAQH